jgi:uncharacterized secreted protein with C-terminal beta-propeller domain
MENKPILDQIIEEEVMEEHPNSKKHWGLLGIFILFIFVGSFFIWKRDLPDNILDKILPTKTDTETLKSFSSAEEFLAYVESGSDEGMGGFFGLSRTFEAAPMLTSQEASDSMTKNAVPLVGGAERISETNVQVLGIDEPDIVKTDGKNIFTSLDRPVLYRTLPEPMPLVDVEGTSSKRVMPLDMVQPTTSIINAFPPADLEKIADIKENGNLLVNDEILTVFGSDQIISYDVSDPKLPEKKWDVQIEDNTSIHTARLFGENIYLITSTYVDYDRPCPLSPLTPVGGLVIPCERVFHPVNPIQTDTTYSVMKINAKTGEITNAISFVGSTQATVAYMSNNAIYVTYTSYGDYADYMYEFFSSLGDDLVSAEIKSKLKNLATYEISSQAKMVEIQSILQNFYSGISTDERRRVENEINNRMEDFATSKMREMEKTGIVKVSLDNLDIVANGVVPGHPLNQFSLDEYKDNLRIATSVGGNSLQGSESANDVYVLNEKLEKVGEVLNLGLDERIYSARFIGKLGYLVTFKQIDPFYVLDLSNPNNPQVKGELKIPGFSSYLHPISDKIILGVGREDNQVKLSLFDVSDSSNPIEMDKYLLDAYWTDVSNTHHAFLQDEKHKVFFLPAGQDGYIFSYTDSSISLIKVVSNINAKRALFLDDYLYIVGENELIVLNETDWERVNSLDY